MSDRGSIHPRHRRWSSRTRDAIRSASNARIRGTGTAPSSREGIPGVPTSPRPSPTRHRVATRGRTAPHVFRTRPPQDGRGPLRPALLPMSTARLLRAHAASGCVVRGWPSLVKGAGLRILSRRGSQVQILPHASSQCYEGRLEVAPSVARSWPPFGRWPVSSPKDRNGHSTGTGRVGWRAHNGFRRTSLYGRLMNPVGAEPGPEPVDGWPSV